MKQKNSDITITSHNFITMTQNSQLSDDKETLLTKLSIEDYNAFQILIKLE